jgi:predicted transcriptional regulator
MKKFLCERISGLYSGSLAEVDIAAMMHISHDSVSNYFIENQKETGDLLPNRGIVHDVGGAVTHKAQIVAEHLENKQTPDAAKKYDHTVKAADRYISSYERVKTAYKNGIPLSKLPFVTNMSKRLVLEYLSLFEKFENENIGNDEYIKEKKNSE